MNTWCAGSILLWQHCCHTLMCNETLILSIVVMGQLTPLIMSATAGCPPCPPLLPSREKLVSSRLNIQHFCAALNSVTPFTFEANPYFNNKLSQELNQSLKLLHVIHICHHSSITSSFDNWNIEAFICFNLLPKPYGSNVSIIPHFKLQKLTNNCVHICSFLLQLAINLWYWHPPNNVITYQHQLIIWYFLWLAHLCNASPSLLSETVKGVALHFNLKFLTGKSCYFCSTMLFTSFPV